MKYPVEVTSTVSISPLVCGVTTVYLHTEPRVDQDKNYVYGEVSLTLDEYSDFLLNKGTVIIDNAFLDGYNKFVLSTIMQTKITDLSKTCRCRISEGLSITLSSGATKHFSFKEEDQVNLKVINDLCSSGQVSEYSYHADGELCTLFTVQDLSKVYNTLLNHKVYHSTYCNHLYKVVRSCTTCAEVESVTYGQELQGELLLNFNKVMPRSGS